MKALQHWISSWGLFTAVFLSLSSRTTAQQSISSSTVRILSPFELAGDYDHVNALFGLPSYSRPILGDLYYASSDLCQGNNFSGETWPENAVVLVDRGGCTFVQKTRGAQKGGAAAVVVADNTCLCSAVECVSEDGTCETSAPVMADDGSGDDIVIPSVLLFKADADRIKEVLTNGVEVQILLQWDVPQTNTSVVQFDIWTTPTEPFSTALIQDLAPVMQYLPVSFQAHQYIYDGIQAGCQDVNGESTCYNLCTNAGRYCSTDPDNDLDVGISGADVTKESLRRLCIWQIVRIDGVGQSWWDYVAAFTEKCSEPDDFANEACINSPMDQAGLDSTAVSMCMTDSGGLEGDVVNTLLEQAIADQTNNGVYTIPTIRIGGVPLVGAVSAGNAFVAICSNYASDSLPEVCRLCIYCVDVILCASRPEFTCASTIDDEVVDDDDELIVDDDDMASDNATEAPLPVDDDDEGIDIPGSETGDDDNVTFPDPSNSTLDDDDLIVANDDTMDDTSGTEAPIPVDDDGNTIPGPGVDGTDNVFFPNPSNSTIEDDDDDELVIGDDDSSNNTESLDDDWNSTDWNTTALNETSIDNNATDVDDDGGVLPSSNASNADATSTGPRRALVSSTMLAIGVSLAMLL